jgi:hypothetical protein
VNRLTYYQLRIGEVAYFTFSLLREELFSFGPTEEGRDYMGYAGIPLNDLGHICTAGDVLRFASRHRFCILVINDRA